MKRAFRPYFIILFSISIISSQNGLSGSVAVSISRAPQILMLPSFFVSKPSFISSRVLLTNSAHALSLGVRLVFLVKMLMFSMLPP